jgi:hypothetical protein
VLAPAPRAAGQRLELTSPGHLSCALSCRFDDCHLSWAEGRSALITNVLLSHTWLTPTALVVLLVGGSFAGARLARRRQLAWGLAGISLVPVALLILVPVDRELFARCTVQWALPSAGRVELMANVLFVGPALLAGVAWRRPLLICLVGACTRPGACTAESRHRRGRRGCVPLEPD